MSRGEVIPGDEIEDDDMLRRSARQVIESVKVGMN